MTRPLDDQAAHEFYSDPANRQPAEELPATMVVEIHQQLNRGDKVIIGKTGARTGKVLSMVRAPLTSLTSDGTPRS